MPTATAIGFLTAPQNSTPTTSSLVYTRKVSLVMAACSVSAEALVGGGDDRGRRHVVADFLGVVGPGERGGAGPGLLLDHLRGALERADLVALRQRELQRALRAPRRDPARHLADGLGRDGVDEQVGQLRSASSMPAKRISSGQAHAGQEVRVLVRRLRARAASSRVSARTSASCPRRTSRREKALPQLPSR